MESTTAFFANLGQGLVGGINLLHDVVMTARNESRSCSDYREKPCSTS